MDSWGYYRLEGGGGGLLLLSLAAKLLINSLLPFGRLVTSPRSAYVHIRSIYI